MFEKVASDGPLAYRAEAMISLSAISWANEQPGETIRYCLEAAKVGNFNATIKGLEGIAVLKGREGYHRSALNDLEKLYPMFRYASPYTYFDYMNSYAVELCNVGRLEEAKNISTLVCSSPFAPYDTEWHNTSSEINQKLYKSRSSVTVPTPQRLSEVKKPEVLSNVIEFPKREAPADDIIAELSKFESVNLTPLQLLGVLLKVVLKDSITNEQIDQICTAYYQLIREYYAE